MISLRLNTHQVPQATLCTQDGTLAGDCSGHEPYNHSGRCRGRIGCAWVLTRLLDDRVSRNEAESG